MKPLKNRYLLSPLVWPFLLMAPIVNAQQKAPSLPDVRTAHETPGELQQLVAPIALYPDALVGQVLTAATFPTQVVEADHWMHKVGAMAGTNLAEEVDRQVWDASTKTLTQFPKVLANMDSNLGWTSSLGEAYINQPQDVMNAIQVMRARATTAGNLSTNSQQKVSNQNQQISVQPSDPQTVYVPQYNPWGAFGAALPAYPGWNPVAGLYLPGQGTLFGAGFGSAYFAGNPWGWNTWGVNWNSRNVTYSGTVYTPHNTAFTTPTPLFFPRSPVSHNPQPQSSPARPGGSRYYYQGNTRVYVNNTSGRYVGQGTRSSAFSGYNRGSVVRANSYRGQISIGRGYTGGSGMMRGGGGGGGMRVGGGGGIRRR